jgi:hypothetical protein
MDLELKEKWVGALRGGDYKQGSKRLRISDEFCCLGVLCDLIDPNGWDIAVEEGRLTIYYWGTGERSSALIPPSVLSEIGLDSTFALHLAHTNDFGATFNHIADVIEESA